MTVQRFHANGKLLLTSEYYVLEGAKALALPTQLGQNLIVNSLISEKEKNVILHWKSFDINKNIWLETQFYVLDFSLVSNFEHKKTSQKAIIRLQEILRQARLQNPLFLSEKKQFTVTTQIEFPLNWGLGSSSTLLCNIAAWAKIDAFELLRKTMGGSGYDIACGQAEKAVLYWLENGTPNVEMVDFSPAFADKLYFVHLGKKQNSREGIKHFYTQKHEAKQQVIKDLNDISTQILQSPSFSDFQRLLEEHENIISSHLQLPKAKDLYFSDFWGAIKSLGAWGGDFVLATSDKSEAETRHYFKEKGFNTFLGYEAMVKN